MAPTTPFSAPTGAPRTSDAASGSRRTGGAPGRGDAVSPGTRSFRPDPAVWLDELGRAPRTCRRSGEASAAVEVRRPETTRRRAGAVRGAALVGLVIALAVAWSVAGWLAGPGSGVEPVGAGTTPEAQTIVVVQPGDTLWSIAAEIEPGGDIRATVDRLADRNGGATLTVGQRLVVSE